MLFNTLQFAIFFAALFAVFRSLPPRHRNGLLLVASLLFYSMWNPPYLFLLLADIAVNYALLRAMPHSRHKRAFLIASISFTLGLLAFFKYAALAVETALPFLAWAFAWRPAVPDLFLPLGISFYSFQIIALTVDTYRGRIEPVRSLRRYALFICFFPQLIAGPILRGYQMLPQLDRGGEPTRERTRRGLWLVTSGLAKKVVLGDFLLGSFVDPVYAAPGLASAPFHLIAAYSFAFQVYFDFSGYADLARGLGLMLGYELPLNFREPYLSRTPTEFWRRWHITLSRWLMDYVYIPLGGNRLGSTRTSLNLFATMLLSGLWHGASWTFVLWGGLHGVLLIAYRTLGRRDRDAEAPLRLRDAPRVFVLFNAMSFLLILFRAPDFEAAVSFMRGVLDGVGFGMWPIFQTGVVVLCFVLHGLERIVRENLEAIQGSLARARFGALAEAGAMGAVFGLAMATAGAGGEFIYFQF